MLKKYPSIYFVFGALLAFFICFPIGMNAQTTAKTTIYLFPGQGSDERIFSGFRPDSTYTLIHIKYPVPVYKMIPKTVIKGGALMLQPIVEPDRKKNKTVFRSMLRSKDKSYLKRTIGMIINWDRQSYSDKIVHIHGTKDHTLPHRKLKCNYTVRNGSHMMTLTRAGEINQLLNDILRSEK